MADLVPALSPARHLPGRLLWSQVVRGFAAAVLVVLATASMACGGPSADEKSAQHVEELATELRDDLGLEDVAGMAAEVEVRPARAFCVCPIATVRGSLSTSPDEALDALRRSGAEHGVELRELAPIDDPAQGGSTVLEGADRDVLITASVTESPVSGDRSELVVTVEPVDR